MTNQEAVLKLKIILGNVLLNPRLKDQKEEFLKAVDMAIAALQSDPNAPNWTQAPDWANWYEIDDRGKGFWHEHEPKKTSAGFIPRKGRIHHSGTPLIPQLFKRPAK